MARVSDITGLTVSSLSELKIISERSHVGFEELSKSLAKLSINLLTAAKTGKGETSDALKDLGLNARQLADAGGDKALEEIAEAISKIENPMQQVSAAASIFGAKVGPQLLPLLKKGKAGIAELKQEAHELGAVLSEEQAEAIGKSNAAWKRYHLAVQGLSNTLAAQLSPILADVGNNLTNVIAATNKAANGNENTTPTVGGLVLAYASLLNVMNQLAVGYARMALEARKALPAVFDVAAAHPQGGEFAQEIPKGIKTIEEAEKELDELTAKVMTDNEGWGDNFLKQQQKVIDAIIKGHKAVAKPIDIEAADNAAKSIQSIIDKMREQVETFGMSAAAQELYRLKVLGANDAIMAQAKNLKEILEQKEKNKKMDEDAASIIKAIQTPQQKYNEELSKAKELMDHGKLTGPQFEDYKKKLQSELFKNKKQELELPSGTDFKSQEARTKILTARYGAGDASKNIAIDTKRIAVATEKLVSYAKGRPLKEPEKVVTF